MVWILALVGFGFYVANWICIEKKAMHSAVTGAVVIPSSTRFSGAGFAALETLHDWLSSTELRTKSP